MMDIVIILLLNYQPLCADFADKACRNQSYTYFGFRCTYGKCINVAL